MKHFYIINSAVMGSVLGLIHGLLLWLAVSPAVQFGSSLAMKNKYGFASVLIPVVDFAIIAGILCFWLISRSLTDTGDTP
jgi:ABC-type lipoprotein release transport system permease subunit